MKPLKHGLLIVGLIVMLLMPSLWVPFPCIKAPCSVGRGIKPEPDPVKTSEPAAIGMDAEHIHAIIQAVLAGDIERTP